MNPDRNVHAHHCLPQKHNENFIKADINIHDPKYGVWWEGKGHLGDAKKYNAEWGRFFLKNQQPSKEQILEHGKTSLYLISERLKNLLEENQTTGWKTFPVKVLDKKKREVPGYLGFSVTGRCGPIDDSKALIIEKRLVPTGPICTYYKGLYIRLDQWDGADFFVPEKTIGIVVTRRTAEILKKNKITNMELENLTEVERNVRSCPKE